MTEAVEAYICEDCTMWHANASTEGVDDPDRLIEVTSVQGVFVPDCGEEAEFCVDFSSSRCDACGTCLAGSRHRAWLVS